MKLRIVSNVAVPHRTTLSSYQKMYDEFEHEPPDDVWCFCSRVVYVYTIYDNAHDRAPFDAKHMRRRARICKKIVHIFFIWRWSSFHSCTRAPTFNINKCLTPRVTRAHKSSLHSKRFKCFFPKENIFITFFFIN